MGMMWEYRLRRVRDKAASVEVIVPAELINAARTPRGLSLEEFLARYQARWVLDKGRLLFSFVPINGQKIERR